MELKTILAIVLCLVIAGGAYTCISGKERNNGMAVKGT